MGRPLKYPDPKIGDVYGEWTVISDKVTRHKDKRWVMCQCSCMRLPIEVCFSDMYTGKSTKCIPCKAKSHLGIEVVYSDIIPDKTLRLSMISRVNKIIDRCYNKDNSRYKWYGARGITVYQPWLDDRKEFYRYLITLPGWDDLSLQIDRRDNNGNYEPGNLRFVTVKVNANNRRPMNSSNPENPENAS